MCILSVCKHTLSRAWWYVFYSTLRISEWRIFNVVVSFCIFKIMWAVENISLTYESVYVCWNSLLVIEYIKLVRLNNVTNKKTLTRSKDQQNVKDLSYSTSYFSSLRFVFMVCISALQLNLSVGVPFQHPLCTLQ